MTDLDLAIRVWASFGPIQPRTTAKPTDRVA